jgi:hypothetical protein
MTRNRLALRRNRRGQLAVRLLVFTAALAGLFVMHGLNDHGASGHDVDAPTDSAVVAMSHTSQMAHDAGDAPEGALTVAGAPGQDLPGVAMAGLCLAVLAGAIIGFLLLRPQPGVIFWRPIVQPFVPAPPSGRRDRDPPSLFELSVLRT